MAIGQRKRQRLNRQRSRARLGDTAALALRPGMGSTSELLARWAHPTRGDLRRLRQAISDDWLDHLTSDQKRTWLDIAFAVMDSPPSTRHALAAVNVFIAADTKNLKAVAALIEAIRKARAP